MTTIATDGAIMAADSFGTRFDLIVADAVSKITRLDDGSLLGMAGGNSTQGLLAEWLNGEGEFPTDHGDWSAIVLRPTGEARLYASKAGKASAPLMLPAAIGSGGELALGAMLAGATPRDSICLAAQRDPFTGGAVTSLSLKD